MRFSLAPCELRHVDHILFNSVNIITLGEGYEFMKHFIVHFYLVQIFWTKTTQLIVKRNKFPTAYH
jgi:hypothetical protein